MISPLTYQSEEQTMQVSVDSALCDGHAECLGWAPDIFELNDEGKAVVARRTE